MIDLKAYTLETVLHALLSECPTLDTTGELRGHAEGLVAIAEAQRVRIEELIAWIHCKTPGKEWSLGEWRAWCRAYWEDHRP